MIIETENLTKIYRTDEVETTALNQVNLQLQKGQFVSIMGPSGCGKSTLLHVLGLIDDLSDGTYGFLGDDVSKYSERKRSALRKKNIGFVFQNFNLIDELTVYENIELPLVYIKSHRMKEKRALKPFSKKWIFDRGAGFSRDNSPADNSNGLQWRELLSISRFCCWRMNPRGTWIPNMATR